MTDHLHPEKYYYSSIQLETLELYDYCEYYYLAANMIQNGYICKKWIHLQGWRQISFRDLVIILMQVSILDGWYQKSLSEPKLFLK